MVVLRILLIGLAFQTVVFVSLWFYARARRREQLEEKWLAEGQPGSLESYVRAGEPEYQAALLRKLVIGVYLVPSTALALLIYLTSSG